MPAQKTNLTIKAPLGGESRRFGFQEQDAQPFTTYFSNNMWPTDAQTGRAVSATRPPLDAFSTPTGLISMLSKINGVASGKPLQSFVTAEDGQVYWWDGTALVAATGTGAAAIETTAPVYAWPFLQKVYIPQFDGKPWVFDYSDGTVEELVESEGTIPDDLRFFVVWQGALWGAGSLTTPNILYGSRAGDATDWDFAAPITDTGGAFFTGGENEGLLNGPITALIPHSRDTMLVSTTEGFVAFRGHPRVTQYVSQHDIPFALGQGAWCKTPDETLYYMSREGLIQVAPGDAVNFVNVSEGKLPDELKGLPYDYENPTICLEYDSLFNGIHITVRGAAAQAWWYDLNAKGFHRMTFSTYPLVTLDFSPIQNANQSSVLYGASDGLKRMDRFGSETIASEITAGPFRMSADVSVKSKMQRAKFVLGEGSLNGSGTATLYAGADAEDVVRRYDTDTLGIAYAIDFNTLQAVNSVCYPKISGAAGMLAIESTEGRIVFEEMVIALQTAGVNRIVKFTSQSLNCQGYATATPQSAPASGALTDGLEMVNLANLPSEWWDLASSTGGNIRVTTENNIFLPFDLLGYDKDNTAGAISLRRPLPAEPTAIRIWCCNQSLALFPPGSEFGQFYSYPPWIIGIWPGGGGRNRTGNTPILPEIDVDPEDENPFVGSAPAEDIPDVCANYGADPVVSIMGIVTVPTISPTEGGDEYYIHSFFPLEACQGGDAGEGNQTNLSLSPTIMVVDDGGGDWTTQLGLMTYDPFIRSRSVGFISFYSNEEGNFPTSTYAVIMTLDDGLVAELSARPMSGADINTTPISGGSSILPQPSFSIRHKGLPSNWSQAQVETQLASQIGSDNPNHRSVTVRGFAVRTRNFSEENEDTEAYEHYLSTFESEQANVDYWDTWTFSNDTGTLSP